MNLKGKFMKLAIRFGMKRLEYRYGCKKLLTLPIIIKFIS